ncbi:MAG TPA: trypsin-like serine protease [Kineosporiaceae bacterium]|nr:trypsin-like serine protease [Kineosporiaceae bacterium]
MRSKKAGLITAVAVTVAAGTATAALGIVGGARVQQAPSWVGSLQTLSGEHECGAALVSPTWAVTAKHCLGVPLGQARFGSPDYAAGGQLVAISGSVKAPGSADVALVRLARPVTLTPAAIAPATPAAGAGVTLLGWGQTAPQPGATDASPFLKQLQTQVLPGSSCRGAGRAPKGVAELCIRSSPRQTACYGDSGGPAVVDGLLVGVTSRGSENCGDVNTVYEDVTALQSWIAQTTGAAQGGTGFTPPAPPVTTNPTPSAPPVTTDPTPPTTPATSTATATTDPALPSPQDLAGSTATASATGSPESPNPTASLPGGLSGLHIQGNWRLRSAPNGPTTGIVRDGDVITVDCQVTGRLTGAADFGDSRIWDHIPGRGFITDLAVAETQYQQRDPRLQTCPASMLP